MQEVTADDISDLESVEEDGQIMFRKTNLYGIGILLSIS